MGKEITYKSVKDSRLKSGTKFLYVAILKKKILIGCAESGRMWVSKSRRSSRTNYQTGPIPRLEKIILSK